MSETTQQHLLYLLKTRGELTAQQLADQLGLTSMGARRQLETAAEQGLLHFQDRSAGVGRPRRWWMLTEAGHARFPDRHGDVIVQLLTHMQTQLGQDGVDKLIRAREAEMARQYRLELDKANAIEDTRTRLADKLVRLTELRSREGYMAELHAQANGWELVEHHCPICAAARQCQAFCRSELQLFRNLLPESTVEREEHLLNAGTRCRYSFTLI